MTAVTPQARSAISDLAQSDPRFAAQAIEDIQAYERLKTEPSTLRHVRRYALFLSLPVYVVPALVLLGGIAVVGGVLWLQSL